MRTRAQEPRVIADGLAFVESARWHEGRLWFAHWRVGEVMAMDPGGHPEVMAPGRPALGWSIDWLPDGRLLVTGESLLQQEADDSFVPHADLTAVARHNWNEIAVDHQRGNLYVNGSDTANLLDGKFPPPGIIALVTADGTAVGSPKTSTSPTAWSSLRTDPASSSLSLWPDS